MQLKSLQEENLLLKSEIVTLKTLVDKGTKESLRLNATIARLQDNIKGLISNEPRHTVDKSLQGSAFKEPSVGKQPLLDQSVQGSVLRAADKSVQGVPVEDPTSAEVRELRQNMDAIAHQISLLPAIEQSLSTQKAEIQELLDCKIREFLEELAVKQEEKRPVLISEGLSRIATPAPTTPERLPTPLEAPKPLEEAKSVTDDEDYIRSEVWEPESVAKSTTVRTETFTELRPRPTPPFLSGIESSNPHVQELRVLLGPFVFGVTPETFFEHFLERRPPVARKGYVYDGEWVRD